MSDKGQSKNGIKRSLCRGGCLWQAGVSSEQRNQNPHRRGPWGTASRLVAEPPYFELGFFPHWVVTYKRTKSKGKPRREKRLTCGVFSTHSFLSQQHGRRASLEAPPRIRDILDSIELCRDFERLARQWHLISSVHIDNQLHHTLFNLLIMDTETHYNTSE